MARAPVEERIIFSSNSIPGNETGNDPVLITVFSVSIIVSFLSSSKIEIFLTYLKLPIPLK